MPFGLRIGPTTFQRVMTEAFQEYLCRFTELFLDNFVNFGIDETYDEYH